MFFQSLDIWSALTFRYPAHIGQEAERLQTVCILFAVTGDIRQRAARLYMACARISLAISWSPSLSRTITALSLTFHRLPQTQPDNLLTFPDLLQYLRNFHANLAVQYSFNDTLTGLTAIFNCQQVPAVCCGLRDRVPK